MEFDATERTAVMDRAPKPVLKAVAFLVVASAIMKATAGPGLATLAVITPEVVAPIVGPIIAEAIPREYKGSKDWGKTARVTSGLHSDGNFFKFDIHRQTSEVNDGVWKKYQLDLVDPDKNLAVQIENLRAIDSGRYGLTLFVAAKMHGWARAVVYERGVHVISIEAEGDASLRLWLDADVGVESVPSSLLVPGLELHPKITDAKLKFDDFRLTRVSDARVVAKIEWHAGELFPRVGFIVTNLSWRSKNVVKFYNGRGTAEQWIKEGKNAVKWTKLSCRTFKDNQSPLAVVRVGLQPGQLPAAAGLAETGATLVADDAAGEADQDRGQGDAAREVRDVPTGRGGGDAEVVRGDPRPHRAVGDAAAIACRMYT